VALRVEALVIAETSPMEIVRSTTGPVPLALLALSWTTYAPGTLGVPLMIPDTESSDNPRGRPTAEYDVGELLATIW
jgi:hypothetical protein